MLDEKTVTMKENDGEIAMFVFPLGLPRIPNSSNRQNHLRVYLSPVDMLRLQLCPSSLISVTGYTSISPEVYLLI